MVVEHLVACAELDQCGEPLKGNNERSCAVPAAQESLICVEEGQNEPKHSPGADARGGATGGHTRTHRRTSCASAEQDSPISAARVFAPGATQTKSCADGALGAAQKTSSTEQVSEVEQVAGPVLVQQESLEQVCSVLLVEKTPVQNPIRRVSAPQQATFWHSLVQEQD